MREISSESITNAIAGLSVKANCILPDDVYGWFKNSLQTEPSPVGKDVLGQLLKNADIARDESMPICQDTGLAVIFAELGQDVRVTGGDFEDAIHEGVRRG